MFVAAVIQHAQRMHCIILSCLACLALPKFPHYLINGTIFGKEKLLNIKMCFYFLYNICLKHL
jgi:hypothetical protein